MSNSPEAAEPVSSAPSNPIASSCALDREPWRGVLFVLSRGPIVQQSPAEARAQNLKVSAWVSARPLLPRHGLVSPASLHPGRLTTPSYPATGQPSEDGQPATPGTSPQRTRRPHATSGPLAKWFLRLATKPLTSPRTFSKSSHLSCPQCLPSTRIYPKPPPFVPSTCHSPPFRKTHCPPQLSHLPWPFF